MSPYSRGWRGQRARGNPKRRQAAALRRADAFFGPPPREGREPFGVRWLDTALASQQSEGRKDDVPVLCAHNTGTFSFPRGPDGGRRGKRGGSSRSARSFGDTRKAERPRDGSRVTRHASRFTPAPRAAGNAAGPIPRRRRQFGCPGPRRRRSFRLRQRTWRSRHRPPSPRA